MAKEEALQQEIFNVFGDPRNGVSFLGECYKNGAKAYEECPVARFEINEINKIIYAFAGNIKSTSFKTEKDIPVHGCEHCRLRNSMCFYK